MKHTHADVKDAEETLKLVTMVLNNVSDEQLLAKVRHRGLDLNGSLSENK